MESSTRRTACEVEGAYAKLLRAACCARSLVGIIEMIYPKALELPRAMSEAYRSVHEGWRP
jgi:hypothetical protein